MPIGLAITCIKINSFHFNFVIPATEHNASSGNAGSKNIKKKTTNSLPFTLSKYLSTVSLSPTTQLTKRLPKNLPSKKATKDPKKHPINEYKMDNHGPNIKLPAKTVIVDGIGIKVTCKNEITINTNGPQKPVLSTISLICSELSYVKPKCLKIKYPISKMAESNKTKINKRPITCQLIFFFCIKSPDSIISIPSNDTF